MPVPPLTQARFCVLSPAEIRDPRMVIDELFDFADLEDIRNLLWEWLKATISGGYHKELHRHDKQAILVLYEKLEKLVEASYVLKTAAAAVKKEGKKKGDG